jgi:sodium-dependent dicarboxylate transporter 2/3/5
MKVKNILFLLLAIIVVFTLHLITLPPGLQTVGGIVLSRAGQSAFAVLIFALILWITEAIPFHITGMLAIFMLAVFKVGSFKDVVASGFGNQVIVFFIGVLILSSFITKSGLGKRISVFILSKTGNRTDRIVLGFLIAGAVLSMWVTNMAVAAILMPLGRTILKEEGCRPLKSNFGKSLMIASAWGPIIGGIATPAGAGPNPIAVGFLKEMAGIDVSFLGWMVYGVPAALLLIIPSWLMLKFFFPPEIKYLAKSKDELKEEYKKLPPMTKNEKSTVVIFGITLFFWLSANYFAKLLNISIPISMTILFTSSLFFLPNVTTIKWKEIESDIAWGSIIFVVSGISLGMMLYRSGAAAWLSGILLGSIGTLNPFLQVLAVVAGVSFLKVAFSSNTVTATIVIPLIITLAKTKGLSVWGMTLPAALTSSLAFILVTSTPTNIIPYSAGYFSILDMAKAGVVMTIVSSVIVAGVIFIIGGFLHVY